jgi:uncharacterized SAM-binding protein YcdF (DUF218 family)
MRSVIVVFGSGTRPDGRITPGLHRRLTTALVCARRQPHAPIIVSGGAVTGPAEGPIMRRWLIAQGVAPQRIVVEDCAKYTLDNALRVAPLVAGLHATTVTLVTQAFHMTRSAALLAGALRRVTSRPVHIRKAAAHDSAFDQEARDLRRGEALKLERDLQTLQALPSKISRRR